ncbi:DUF460 domain-containing protein [Methanobacterium sp.]|uniref:DUF460 domain-containing protein n=1 Tax=Methanobacterium sp. TaxID=2164 RepID=UPI002ABAF4BC|nr:DUF460 domain-containing protein [Methanobacterium sp.]MDY9922229.1 DUF460 domain-containing protein [Methanobacterium sp.]
MTPKGQRGIIVGLDPGMTVGVAILNLSGKILSVNSFKEVSRAEITKHIISFGRTVLVATDVHQPPKMVKKMATSLNSKIYAPYRDLAVAAKNEMVDDYIYSGDNRPISRRSRDTEVDLIPQNAHERDALAAAIQGYKKYQKKLELIKKKALNMEIPSEMVDEVKIMVINEVPITKALNATMEKLKHPVTPPTADTPKIKSSKLPPKEDIFKGEMVPGTFKEDSQTEGMFELISGLKSKLKSQEKQIKNLQKKNSIMVNDLKRYQDEISQLESKIERLHYQYSQNILHQKEIATKTSIIRGLQEKYNHEKALKKDLEEQLESIKRIRAMELSREASPVKIIESFSKDAIREATGAWNIKNGDVVLLRSSEGGGSHTAALLVHLGVKAVITTDKMSHQARGEFETNMVPIIPLEAVDLKLADDFAVIMSQDLETEIVKWEKNQEEKRKKEDTNKLLKIMDDYRAKRKRSPHNF